MFRNNLRRLVAEWEPQNGVMLTWPHDKTDWASDLSQVEAVYLTIAIEIGTRENLLVVCADAAQRDDVRTALMDVGVPKTHLSMGVSPSNDTWMRDYGPLSVESNGRPGLVKFEFNGWNNRYKAAKDNAMVPDLVKRNLLNRSAMEYNFLILEGGSIESDGGGSIMATRRCLMESNRNAHMSEERLEESFAELLGCRRMLWLHSGGLAGDDTDGHVDMLARFCDKQTIAYQSCDEPDYEFYDELKTMEGELQAFETLDGVPYRLIPLPWPAAKNNQSGDRLPASYANFLIINGAVLVPTYEDSADQQALDALQEVFPDREIIPIPCLPIIQQFGSLHCLTMQVAEGIRFGGARL